MNKKIFLIVIIVLILFSGLIAVTQETDYFFVYKDSRGIPDWVLPIRWFRSNNGGMAIEEVESSVIAFRNEYALSIDFTGKNNLPEFLYPYYKDEYFIEVRILYQKGRQIRTQWIFRDIKGTTRVVGVFLQPDNADEEQEKQTDGFIEIYDEKSFLITEYRFFKNGIKNRVDYSFKDNLLVSSTVYLWEDNAEGGEYSISYIDLLRYNRSLFLRAVERVFYKERKVSVTDDSLRAAFPRNLADAANIENLIREKLNSYPEFFGEVLVYKNERIVFTTDERSRILTQTLYDKEDNIIWVINNTWKNDRIVSTLKKEGDTEYLAEYVYNSDGDRILEKNYKNGALERLVHTEGKTDIEELYFNDIVVLRAVWEDGRKISETRVENR